MEMNKDVWIQGFLPTAYSFIPGKEKRAKFTGNRLVWFPPQKYLNKKEIPSYYES